MVGNLASAKVTTIQKWSQYIAIQDGGYLVLFGMNGLFGFGMTFKIRTIQRPDKFRPFKFQTCSVFQPQLYKQFSPLINRVVRWKDNMSFIQKFSTKKDIGLSIRNFNCDWVIKNKSWKHSEKYDSAFLLLRTVAKWRFHDATLNAVAFKWGER